MSKCAGCAAEIQGSEITALNQTWHPDCFRCASCKEDFADGAFVNHENKPYHDACYDKLFADRCSGCDKVIEARSTHSAACVCACIPKGVTLTH